MADTVYSRGLYLLATVGLAGLNLRAALVTGTATGADDTDLNTVAQLDAVVGVGIHTERLTLASVTATENDANHRVDLDCANLSFAIASGVTAHALVIYDEGDGTDAGRQLISIHTTGFPKALDTGLNITITDWLRNS